MNTVLGVLVIVAGILAASSTLANECSSITDPAKRLQCYDAGSKPKSPRFADYPAKPFGGKHVLPAYAGTNSKYAMYEMHIGFQLEKGINFAGHYALVGVGCGTECMFFPVVDLKNGDILQLPFTGSGFPFLDLSHNARSRLVKIAWTDKGRCFKQDFVLEGSKFNDLGKRDTGRAASCSKSSLADR